MDFLIIILILMFLCGANVKFGSKQEEDEEEEEMTKRKVVDTDKITILVDDSYKLTEKQLVDIVKVFIDVEVEAEIQEEAKKRDDDRYYNRDACGNTYYLVDGVIFGVATNDEGGFDRAMGCPVTQFHELDKDEFHNLIMELVQYFNKVNL